MFDRAELRRLREMAVLAGEDWEPVPETCDCGAGVPCAHGEYLYGLRFPYVLPVWESSNAASGDDEAEYVRQATSIDELPSGVGDFIVEFTPSKVMALIDALLAAPVDPSQEGWEASLADECWEANRHDAGFIRAIKMFRARVEQVQGTVPSLREAKEMIEAAMNRNPISPSEHKALLADRCFREHGGQILEAIRAYRNAHVLAGYGPVTPYRARQEIRDAQARAENPMMIEVDHG